MYPNPVICQVSTDSASNYNYNTVYWDNAQFQRADSFYVYRYDLGQNSYLKIGRTAKTQGYLKDTSRYTGSSFGTNGDPNYGSYRYKIAFKDTLGYMSNLGKFHLTQFLQNQFNGNFNLSAYGIETGQTNDIIGYALMRDNNGTGNYYQIATMPTGATSAFDPQYSNYPNSSYRVDVFGFNCAGVGAKTTGLNKSHSNITKKITDPTGIKDLTAINGQVKIYPNPANEILIVEVSNANNVQCSVYDVLGSEVLSLTVNHSATLDIRHLKSGLYFLKVGNGVGKFVKE